MKNRIPLLPVLMIVGTLIIIGFATYGFHKRLVEKRAETNLRDLVEGNALRHYDEAWQTMEALDREALKEIDRINRLREANKDVKDLNWWKRLNEQGDEIKRIADDIGKARTTLTVIKVSLYYDGKPPTLKELNEAQSQLRAIEEFLKEIREALTDLKSA